MGLRVRLSTYGAQEMRVLLERKNGKMVPPLRHSMTKWEPQKVRFLLNSTLSVHLEEKKNPCEARACKGDPVAGKGLEPLTFGL